ncbi:MAG: hypothetical protein JO290_09675 [Sphingomonadaceae bacterium]|nr:hypothetical protein [Sphingomonadaceae bacterium]
MATAFDTLKTYEAIVAAGVDDKAARAISKAIADSIATYREDLATKTDLKLATTALDAKIDTRVAELKELIASTQNRTIIWMFGMLVAFSGVIIGAIKLIP